MSKASGPQPFELPDFYLPWPARLNPNLEGARTHSKAWSKSLGIIGAPEDKSAPEIWSEAKFDAMDYALLCSYTHPEAPGPELDLITDWYVWVFYFDDLFDEDDLTGDPVFAMCEGAAGSSYCTWNGTGYDIVVRVANEAASAALSFAAASGRQSTTRSAAAIISRRASGSLRRAGSMESRRRPGTPRNRSRMPSPVVPASPSMNTPASLMLASPRPRPPRPGALVLERPWS